MMKQLGSTVSQRRWVPNTVGLKNSFGRNNQHMMLLERGGGRGEGEEEEAKPL